MSSKVSQHIEYIESLFQKVQTHFFHISDWKTQLDFLESENTQFKSIAYESASVEIANKDLAQGSYSLPNWRTFKEMAGEEHKFHIEIGLGWAYAKFKRFPASTLRYSDSDLENMKYDGMGYFNSLYRQKKTIDALFIPPEFDDKTLPAYDQGIGRRIWYKAKGDPNKAYHLSLQFPKERQAALWRGIGIACGYVGGNTTEELKLLKKLSKEHLILLREGIFLVAEIRQLSQDNFEDIDRSCRILCDIPFKEISKKIPS